MYDNLLKVPQNNNANKNGRKVHQSSYMVKSPEYNQCLSLWKFRSKYPDMIVKKLIYVDVKAIPL